MKTYWRYRSEPARVEIQENKLWTKRMLDRVRSVGIGNKRKAEAEKWNNETSIALEKIGMDRKVKKERKKEEKSVGNR